MLKNNEINLRDPFVVPYEGKYYLYGSRGATCWSGTGDVNGFDCYVGTDLENWSEPINIFKYDESFWADRNFWAPECHLYNGYFYLFASFKAEGVCRGTQILKSDSPTGMFVPHSDGVITPKSWECLDGTLYIDKNDIPYMVFCHEWVQVTDGEMVAVELSKDLKCAVGEPFLLFRASEPDWANKDIDVSKVTDGPYLYRLSSGDLIMLWSSFSNNNYVVAIARSSNGDIDGEWTHEKELLFDKDGGHAMIFKTFDNRIMIALHSPNSNLNERPLFIELEEKDNALVIK